MKLSTDKLPAAQTSGDMVTLDMGISDNADDQLMILNVLSASLYTDKPAAVLREYGCNAFDANVEAGKGNVPIEVGLPNKLEPSLRIRDFGFGMTEEQIASTFVKLGRSTKRNSNAFTGMLGIGSKSGFAYGDSFMVTSFIGGHKVVYNAFRDRGAPRLAKMLGPSPTPEPDGIEIKVPVRMEHFEEFRQKAERIYRYFKVRPKITGAQVEFLDAERLMSGTGWHYTGSGKSVAIMGNVGYDLNLSGMGGLSLDLRLLSLIQQGVELEFAIGDLEVAASREGLQYKDITKKAVMDRLKVALSELGKTFTDQISKAPCMWEARKQYGQIFERLGNSNVRTLKEIIDGHVKWNGQVINTGRMSLTTKDPEVNVYRVFKQDWRQQRMRETTATTCYASDKTTLVINDLPSKSQSPARERGFFEDPANKDITEWVVFTFQSDAAHKRYWREAHLEGAPTILMTSITPAVSATLNTGAPRVHNSKHSAKAFVLDESAPLNWGGARSLFWKQETVNLKKDSGSYVVLKEFYAKRPNTLKSPIIIKPAEHPIDLINKVKALRAAGLIVGPVYGFKVAALTNFTGASTLGPGWVKLETEIQDRLDTAIKQKKLAQETADYIAATRHQPLILPEHAPKFPPCPVRDMLEKILALRNPKGKETMHAVLKQEELSPWLQKIVLPGPSVSLDSMRADVLKEYPLLGYVTGLASMPDGHIQFIAEFIRLVEAAKPKQTAKKSKAI